MKTRFVKAGIVRLSLSDNDWIDVKKRLNTAETRRVFARMARDLKVGEGYTFNPEQMGLSKVLEYLLGWSLTDEGTPVAYRPDMSVEERETIIGNLDPQTFKEIRDAIDAHEEREDAARAAEKNEAGEAMLKATSPSPSIAIGNTPGLVN